MPKYIVLLGPPGAGKGTQATIIAKKLNLAHISSGNIFRENIDNQTELGKRAQGYMDQGQLVPDDLTIAMVRDRLAQPDCQAGAVLDGFPRTAAQAQALERNLAEQGNEIQCVPYINVPDETLIERLSGRWTCTQAGHVYHLKFSPPQKAGFCDKDGSPLYQRSDDHQETVENRIRVYGEQTAPLIDYYRQAGILFEIDGICEIEQVTQSILECIEKTNK